VRSLLVGSDGKLRPLWRAALFFVLAYWLLPLALDPVAALVADRFGIREDLSASSIAVNEIENLIVAFVATAIFARYERRRIDSYGLPVRQVLGSPTWDGVAIGIVMAAGVALGMYLLGGMQVHGLATHGTELLVAALAWLGANICVGLAEELWFRAYWLQTLWKSIGFWPASMLIALFFAADHYFFKAGENLWDVITLVSLSLLMCYSVLRSGTLWFAVGFHVAFDYMQLFVIGSPNGNRVPQGRFLDVSFNGPDWLTGGVLGTEASFLMYPLIALAWLYVWWRYRPVLTA
jgi:membrane protease YdiL (CAAX protease family)